MLNVVMPSVANKPFSLSVFMLSVVMLNVVAPFENLVKQLYTKVMLVFCLAHTLQ